MRIPFVAAVIAAFFAGPARADEISFASRAVDIPAGSRLEIGLTNSCETVADFRLRVRDAAGTLLLSRNGQLPARGDAGFTVTPEAAVTGVVITVRLDCAAGTPKPWLSYLVQKAGEADSKPSLGELRAPLAPRLRPQPSP